MNRKEFLKQFGGGAVLALTVGCLGGCMGASDTSPVISDLDMTIDLTDSNYASLQNNGSYVVIDNQVVVARTASGELVAATRTCSHEPRKLIRLRNDRWYCSEHGAQFTLSGTGLNSEASNGLQVFQTSQNGNQLRIFS
ncbi:Rieske (2Fe-2S) protein [Roseivirga sp.]|uniref:Rieske (2Fe-2S) protein n=1 Tax=Roseivirga sp. TaxID=1964215 RepID=UPI003B524621